MKVFVVITLMTFTAGAKLDGYAYRKPTLEYVQPPIYVPPAIFSQQVNDYSSSYVKPINSYNTNGISSSYQDYQAQGPLVSKHFYYHAAPEESIAEVQHRTLSLGQPKKHYRVVFIKAPTEHSAQAKLTVQQAADEEQTVIYVLSKKTDVADIKAELQSSQTVNSKPEVHFIKYKTPEEAALAQQQIKTHYETYGGSTYVSDEGYAPVKSFIGALDASKGSAVSVNHNLHLADNIQSAPQKPSTGYLPPAITH